MCVSVHVVAFVLLARIALAQRQDVAESREVSLAQGPVRGYKSPDFNVFEYFNIPYATAPLGVDKFKAPLPPPSWNDTLDAVDRRIICPQPGSHFGPTTEDCLVANIFTPDALQRDLPVLVIVHGGGYQVALGTLMAANGLVDSQKVIVVTFNYRLSVHGFLCLGTEEVPGNAGMKDQVAALRWVKDNVESFGGNPDDVTITGCSSGGSAVHLLLLSKLTDGLFNKVIADSGCSISPFSAQLDPLQNAKNHVHILNVTNVDVGDITALTEFYTTSPLENLLDFVYGVTKDSYYTFQPCVEKDIGQEMFLDDAPMNILKSGNFKKLPMLYGYAEKEGLLALEEFNDWIIKMNEKFSDFLPADLEFENEQQKEEMAKEVKEFYFGNETINESNILDYIDYFTDVTFISSILRTITFQVQANNTEVYLYEYSFVHNGSQMIPHVNERGADHCDQVQILEGKILDPEFVEMSRTMRQMYLNFIHTGNPTPPERNSTVTWLPSGEDRSPHLSIGSIFQMLGIPAKGRPVLWDAIYESHYRTPIAPNPNAAVIHVFSKPFWIIYAVCVLIIYGK